VFSFLSVNLHIMPPKKSDLGRKSRSASNSLRSKRKETPEQRDARLLRTRTRAAAVLQKETPEQSDGRRLAIRTRAAAVHKEKQRKELRKKLISCDKHSGLGAESYEFEFEFVSTASLLPTEGYSSNNEDFPSKASTVCSPARLNFESSMTETNPRDTMPQLQKEMIGLSAVEVPITKHDSIDIKMEPINEDEADNSTSTVWWDSLLHVTPDDPCKQELSNGPLSSTSGRQHRKPSILSVYNYRSNRHSTCKTEVLTAVEDFDDDEGDGTNAVYVLPCSPSKAV